MYSKEEAKQKKAYYLKNRKTILAKRKAYRGLNRKLVNDIAKKSYENRKAIVSIARKSKYWGDAKFRKKINKINRFGNRRWYSTRKQLVSDKRQLLKAKVIAHYSKGTMKCECCGETELVFLTIDHKLNDGNLHRQRNNLSSGYPFYTWLVSNNFPSKPVLQVLCWNCNWAKRYQGGCPHKRGN